VPLGSGAAAAISKPKLPLRVPVAGVQTSGDGLVLNTSATVEPELVSVADPDVTVMVPVNGPTAVAGTRTVAELALAVKDVEFVIVSLGAEVELIMNV
jgi:hypothetical protein